MFPPHTNLHDVLVFDVGGRRYGLPLGQVVEVIRAVTIVPLPRAPVVIEGVINLRGAIVPVFDLRSRFGLPAKALEPADQFIVAQAGQRTVAIRVDQALDLVPLGADALVDSNSVPGAEYVRWIVRLPEELLLIHDLETFLSRAEAVELAEALPAASAGAADEGAGP